MEKSNTILLKYLLPWYGINNDNKSLEFPHITFLIVTINNYNYNLQQKMELKIPSLSQSDA